MRTIAFYNLGCKVNAFELEQIQQQFAKKGYLIVPFADRADIYLVNTCTVTNIADHKSRQILRRARKANPNAVVAALGCYVDSSGREPDAEIDLAIGNADKPRTVEILEAYLANRGGAASGDIAPDGSGPAGGPLNGDVQRAAAMDGGQSGESGGDFPSRVRAFVKISDGCNQFCSYCIIPYVRGRVRSRPPREILEEVRSLAGRGIQEVVITGIHLASYGTDFVAPYGTDFVVPCGTDFVTPCGTDSDRGQGGGIGEGGEGDALLRLLEDISGIDGIRRIRLGSLDPRVVTEEFARRLRRIPQFCPHFHLSLQSGCDATLQRMNRHYSVRECEEKVSLLREVFDRPAITADVIAGFPQETEEEFACTYATLQKMRCFALHVFPYSRRKGTAADRMEGQLTRREKEKRCARLLALNKACSQEYRASFLGEQVEILVEERKRMEGRDWWVGHTQRYVKAAFPAPEGEPEPQCLENQLVRGIAGGFLTPEILSMEGAGNDRHLWERR